MSTKASHTTQLEINTLRDFRAAVETALEKCPAGIDQMPFVKAISDIDIMIGGLADRKTAELAAEEVARLNAAKPITIRRHSWDADDKVKVILVPTAHSDSAWYVQLDGRTIGTITNYMGGHSDWSASVGTRRTTYGSKNTRVDAIRTLLPRG